MRFGAMEVERTCVECQMKEGGGDVRWTERWRFKIDRTVQKMMHRQADTRDFELQDV